MIKFPILAQGWEGYIGMIMIIINHHIHHHRHHDNHDHRYLGGWFFNSVSGIERARHNNDEWSSRCQWCMSGRFEYTHIVNISIFVISIIIMGIHPNAKQTNCCICLNFYPLCFFQMFSQNRCSKECIIRLIALVWFFSTVDFYVSSYHKGQPESFTQCDSICTG